MKESDPTSLFLGIAALGVALWLHTRNTESQTALNQCRSDFHSFREGVLYGR